jgi:enamine deaminase RidA (YjgF/YER057c/UK114 family)
VERPVSGSPHRIVNPPDLAPPVGFSHVVVGAPGTTVFLAGQTGHDPEGNLSSSDLVAQFDTACANVARALASVGSSPDHLVTVQIYVTDVAEYRDRSRELGAAYQAHLGRHYPAMAVMGVSALFDPGAKVELVCTAVVPETRTPG